MSTTRQRQFFAHPAGGYVRLDLTTVKRSRRGPVFQGDWLRDDVRYPSRYAFYPEEWTTWTRVAKRDLPSRVHFFFTYDSPQKYARYLLMQNARRRKVPR